MKPNKKLQIIQQLSGLTQTQLASRLNVSFPTLNSWINETLTTQNSPHE